MEPSWILLNAVLAIQEELVARFGGIRGIRDHGLLESALNRPRQRWAYENPEPSLSALAAAYAAGIIQSHPFLDGNKRAGFLTAYVFLGINRRFFRATEADVVRFTLGMAAGEITEAEYAAWIERSCQ